MNNTQSDLKTSDAPPTPSGHCPWCGNAVSHRRFAEIETKIRQQEQVKLAESAKQLRVLLEAEHAAELTRQRQLSEEQAQRTLASQTARVGCRTPEAIR